jgi:hypothetical protein
MISLMRPLISEDKAIGTRSDKYQACGMQGEMK